MKTRTFLCIVGAALLGAGLLLVFLVSLPEDGQPSLQILRYTLEPRPSGRTGFAVEVSVVFSNGTQSTLFVYGRSTNEPHYWVSYADEAGAVLNPQQSGTGFWWRQMPQGCSVTSTATFVLDRTDAEVVLACEYAQKDPTRSVVGKIASRIPLISQLLWDMKVMDIFYPRVQEAAAPPIRVWKPPEEES